MIRTLLSKIPSIERSDWDAIDFTSCKVFPKNLEYDQHEKQIASLIGHSMCERVFFDLNIPQHELNTLHQNVYGKWQLEKSLPDFTISHSHDYVIVSVTDEGRVGVDLEKLRAVSVADYKNCFTPAEWILSKKMKILNLFSSITGLKRKVF